MPIEEKGHAGLQLEVIRFPFLDSSACMHRRRLWCRKGHAHKRRAGKRRQHDAQAAASAPFKTGAPISTVRHAASTSPNHPHHQPPPARNTPDRHTHAHTAPHQTNRTHTHTHTQTQTHTPQQNHPQSRATTHTRRRQSPTRAGRAPSPGQTDQRAEPSTTHVHKLPPAST